MQEYDSQSKSEGPMELVKQLIKWLFIQFHVIFDLIIDFCFGLYYMCKPQKRIPAIKNNLLLKSASELAKMIRMKKISSVEVVTAFIERAKEVNGAINAVVEDRYSDAIEEAKEVDKILSELENADAIKEKKPFLGVPFTTKECHEVKGMLHTLGLVSRRNYRSEDDATVVRLVKEAGGILIAKTNTPEMLLWTESRNNLYGQTCNPYNTTRNAGGSSGGEGAIIAACGAAFSVASDVGGSTRMPAFFNGVFGHKPSAGSTTLKGVGLRQVDVPNSMAETGPICKKAEDLVPLLKVFVGDKISLLNLDVNVNIKDLNFFYQESSDDIRASKVNCEMQAALLKVVQHLKKVSGSATEIQIPGSEYSYRLWRFWLSRENFDFKLNITNGKYRANGVTELKKFLTGKSELTFAAIMYLIDEDLLPKDDPEWAISITKNMEKYLMDKLEGNGVLIYPSSPFPAGYHYTAYLRPFNFGYWGLFNVLKFPVCQVPVGLDKNGLPLGVQKKYGRDDKVPKAKYIIDYTKAMKGVDHQRQMLAKFLFTYRVVAAPYNDHLCLAVARELEKEFGGWVPPV